MNESTGCINNGGNDHLQDMFSSLLVRDDDDDLSFLMSIDTDFGPGATDFDLQLFRGDQAAVCQESNNVGIIVSGVDCNDVISSSSPCGYSSSRSSGQDQVKVESGLTSGQIPSLHGELKKLASFLDLEDDWTEPGDFPFLGKNI